MERITHGDPCVNGSCVPSSAAERLVAANVRLRALRQQKGTVANRSAWKTVPSAEKPNIPRSTGWLAPLTILAPKPILLAQPVIPAQTGIHASPTDTITFYPDIGTAFLREGLAAIGRIYLLARHLDTKGQGWISVNDLRAALTNKTSPLRVCGWRRLRQLLQEGKNILWERDRLGRLWLFGRIRVATTLNIQRFTLDAIKTPVRDILGTIGNVQATFYAAFHCGRDANPISRATLQTITGVPERTQRHYDDAHNTKRTSNFSLVADAGDQGTTWQHGRAAFTFRDNLGKHGTAGKCYTAIRLPNSYNTTRYARLTGKRKRLNHKLKQDLANHGTQGNSNEQVRQLFFSDGQKAARVFNRNSDIYLCDQGSRNVIFWTRWAH